jgi:hypothetical protein
LLHPLQRPPDAVHSASLCPVHSGSSTDNVWLSFPLGRENVFVDLQEPARKIFPAYLCPRARKRALVGQIVTASQRSIQNEACSHTVGLSLGPYITQLHAHVPRLKGVSHESVHPPRRDPDLSCRCCSCWSCCCRLIDVAKHAAADRVPRAVGAVVTDVGIPRCHGHGPDYLLV